MGREMLEIDLRWPVASDYVVRPTAEVYGSVEEPALYPADGATVTLQRPLEANPSLYREFAKLDGSEQACLDFARKNGFLFARPNGALGHEPLRFWREHIEYLNRIIRFCELGHANPPEALRQFGRQEFPLHYDFVPTLSLGSPRAPPFVSMRCNSLLGAIEFQAAQSILSRRKSVRCFECGGLFEIGAGAGARRSLAKFCSNQCKDRFHNRQKREGRTP